ncbi:DUF6191 domain-containing protein [Streptomyces sp. Je 1-79]|uniref:DUF6191 domain-containing protein n=1 Tax=Streptomyces sp. Je 1-79 TaxID=2943847 RepID=UPI0021A2A92D|nr:DUF6191 domain-containing protein [Streptomyces sp. Je 1-79]MCT4354248.1 DUF6191 domain-containing protein [Streptomyces sp. Je 1-79]
MFNLMEELFAPGRKHTDDERQRLELTREDLGDGDPGRGPIDLGSGAVTIRVPAPPARDDEDGRGGGEDGEDGGRAD